MRSLYRSKLFGIVKDIAEAPDGLEAWSLLADQKFSIAIVDLMMPNLDGFTLIQCARGHPKTRHMPIVVVSSNEDMPSLRRALDVGASAFMTKPLNWALFGDHVAHLLRLSQAAEQADLKITRLQALTVAQDALMEANDRILGLHLRGLKEFTDAAVDANWAMPRLRLLGSSTEAACRLLNDARLMIPSYAAVNEQAHSLRQLLADAQARVVMRYPARRVTIGLPATDTTTLMCSSNAVAYVVSTLLQSALRTTSDNSIIDVGVKSTADHLTVGFALPAGSGSERLALDLAAPAGLNASLLLEPARLEMACVRALMAAHEGNVEVISATGGACEVSLRFPVERVRMAAPVARSTVADSSLRARPATDAAPRQAVGGAVRLN